MKSCIFCKIVSGEASSHCIWEDKKHVAFLSIFPNMEGFSVVIPKAHHPSYAFELPDEILTELVLASKKVARLLDTACEDVGRTGMIFEGFGFDHVYAKLVPMHALAISRKGNFSNRMSIGISSATRGISPRKIKREQTMRSSRNWPPK